MRIHGVTGSMETDGILSSNQQHALNQRQREVSNRVLEYWEDHGLGSPYPLVAMPTGFGKSRVMHHLIKSIGTKTLLIVGTKNILLDQNIVLLRSKVQAATGEKEFSVLPDVRERVVLTTWQGLDCYMRKYPRLPKFGLVVIDEVHNTGTTRRLELLDKLQPTAVIGLTATAFRSNGIYRTPKDYKFSIIDAMTLPECIDHRWLSPLMGLCMDTEVVLPKEVVSGRELNSRQLFRALRHHPDLFRNIAQEIGERFLPSGMKTIIVVNRVYEEACVIALVLQEMGFRVGLAVNKSASRTLYDHGYITNQAIDRFQLPHDHPDSLQALISPQVISEGFDAPATECVIWAAPTLSSLRYTQVMGRGARRCPGKKYCLVVDFVYMIDGYGYSMNFAQFFRQKEIKLLEGGFMYVGPAKDNSEIVIPTQFTNGANIVSIVDIQSKSYVEADDWLTIWEISRQIGKSFAWTEKHLDLYSDLAEKRIDKCGRLKTHWPPSVLESLGSEMGRELWFTEHEIIKRVGKSRKWALNRLRNYNFLIKAMEGADGRIRQHYPRSVLDALLEEAGNIKEAGEMLSLRDIFKSLGHNINWLRPRIKKYATLAEMRRGRNGKISLHYPPSILDELRKLNEI